jgi:hypothetical protein
MMVNVLLAHQSAILAILQYALIVLFAILRIKIFAAPQAAILVT